jgi:hypothetical protein
MIDPKPEPKVESKPETRQSTLDKEVQELRDFCTAKLQTGIFPTPPDDAKPDIKAAAEDLSMDLFAMATKQFANVYEVRSKYAELKYILKQLEDVKTGKVKAA